MLALRRLAGRHIELKLLAPKPEFAPRPASVAAPFGLGGPAGIPSPRSGSAGVSVRPGALTAVKPEGRVAYVDNQGALTYDTLVVAVGARARAAVPGALTFTGLDAGPSSSGCSTRRSRASCASW